MNFKAGDRVRTTQALEHYVAAAKDKPIGTVGVLEGEDNFIVRFEDGSYVEFIPSAFEHADMPMSMLDYSIRPGWAASPYDWQITSAYVDALQQPVGDLTVQQQLSAIIELFNDYRQEFGQLDAARCPKCHCFYDEFNGCWCEDKE